VVSVNTSNRAGIRPAFDPKRSDDNVLENVAQRFGFLDSIRAHPVLGWIYRALIAVLGGLVVILGFILIPAPGPGWLVVFAGLGILATEFAWAQRILHRVKTMVGAWTHWIMTKPLWMRLLVGAAGICFLLGLTLLTLYTSGWKGFPFD
jgi:uncharacterized protein (TIGR02611 family)